MAWNTNEQVQMKIIHLIYSIIIRLKSKNKENLALPTKDMLVYSSYGLLR
jgi:hypothetical protein